MLRALTPRPAADYTASGFQRMTSSDPARWRALCLGALALFLVLSAGAALGTLPGDVAVRALVRAHLGSEAGPLFHGVNRGGTWLVLLPATALLQSGDGAQVWVVSEDTQVHRRTVELLEFDMDSVVVGAGLAPGEMVVTAGVYSMAEGQAVKPEMEAQ